MKTNVRKQKKNEMMREAAKARESLLSLISRNSLEQPDLPNWQTWRRN